MIFNDSVLHGGVLDGVPLHVHLHIVKKGISEKHFSWRLVILNWYWLKGFRFFQMTKSKGGSKSFNSEKIKFEVEFYQLFTGVCDAIR